MAEIFLETFDLTVGYRGNPLIKDINISVALGEIVTMIGPNGAGKSTILKSITTVSYTHLTLPTKRIV